MNIPYVKEYNSDGTISNPIVGRYETADPKSTRDYRKHEKKRFRGNKKGISLTVGQKFKYVRAIQWIGEKQIEHYTLR